MSGNAPRHRCVRARALMLLVLVVSPLLAVAQERVHHPDLGVSFVLGAAWQQLGDVLRTRASAIRHYPGVVIRPVADEDDPLVHAAFFYQKLRADGSDAAEAFDPFVHPPLLLRVRMDAYFTPERLAQWADGSCATPPWWTWLVPKWVHSWHSCVRVPQDGQVVARFQPGDPRLPFGKAVGFVVEGPGPPAIGTIRQYVFNRVVHDRAYQIVVEAPVSHFDASWPELEAVLKSMQFDAPGGT